MLPVSLSVVVNSESPTTYSGTFSSHVLPSGKTGVTGFVSAVVSDPHVFTLDERETPAGEFRRRSATFTVDDDGIKFGDGYALHRRVLADSPSEIVVSLSASRPNLKLSPEAIVRVDRVTGAVTSFGLGSVISELRGSHELQFLNNALPMLSAAMKERNGTSISKTNGLAGNVVAEGWFSCAGEVIVLVLDFIGVILACGIPEPLEPLACGIALSAFVITGALVAHDCAE
jgi:hypothetical protein